MSPSPFLTRRPALPEPPSYVLTPLSCLRYVSTGDEGNGAEEDEGEDEGDEVDEENEEVDDDDDDDGGEAKGKEDEEAEAESEEDSGVEDAAEENAVKGQPIRPHLIPDFPRIYKLIRFMYCLFIASPQTMNRPSRSASTQMHPTSLPTMVRIPRSRMPMAMTMSMSMPMPMPMPTPTPMPMLTR